MVYANQQSKISKIYVCSNGSVCCNNFVSKYVIFYFYYKIKESLTILSQAQKLYKTIN